MDPESPVPDRSESGLRYHEAWANDGAITEHWGLVGEQGETQEHALPDGADEEEAIQDILRPAEAAGFTEIEDLETLLIEYSVEGFGIAQDLEKRHDLESRMDETLGWTGLGHCDGGNIGSGTMEACCLVVDFEIAKRVIEADLRDTRFGDYTRIYREGTAS